MKKVSVIMSTYKTEPAILEEAISSILNQTYKNIEFIIVCDGDLEEYNRIKDNVQDERIKILFNQQNKGLPYSLNLAIKNSTGDYIARMDSDDVSLNYRIEKQVEFLEKNQNIGVCATEAMLFGTVNKRKKVYLKNIEEIKVQLLYRATLIHPTVMIRKEILNEFKYDEEFICAQDFELWSRISEMFDIAILPIIGLKYRVHQHQISVEKKQKQTELAMRIIKNNSKKITGQYNEKICNTLYVLSARKEMSRKNYKEISENIDYIISQNKLYKKYNSNVFKKVLYNRFFELIIKNKIVPMDTRAILKCFKLYNLKEILQIIKQ